MTSEKNANPLSLPASDEEFAPEHSDRQVPGSDWLSERENELKDITEKWSFFKSQA